jgi:thiol-disulfide isomerase/thioredoxin
LIGCSKEPNEINSLAKTSTSAAPLTSTPDATATSADAPPIPPKTTGFYTVDHYDESGNPAADLAKTVERASKERKRILIQVGGDWCIWCKRMSAFMEKNTPLNKELNEHFLVMKVNYSKDQPNKEFLSKYPKISGYPHLYVLESDGKLLHSQDTSPLEDGKSGYNEGAFLKFLAAWHPKAEAN